MDARITFTVDLRTERKLDATETRRVLKELLDGLELRSATRGENGLMLRFQNFQLLNVTDYDQYATQDCL